MTRQDRQRWNAKYLGTSFPTEPSQIVRRFHALAPKGRALDIAAGAGRNALFLAERGYRVDAVDVSDVAMGRLARSHPLLQPVCADLDTFDIRADTYALILNIRFLNRRLFPYMEEALVKGGILIFESYLETAGRSSEGPSCRDYLLRENELLHAFLGLRVLFYQEAESMERKGPSHTASLVALKRS